MKTHKSNGKALVFILEATSGGAKRHVIDILRNISVDSQEVVFFYSKKRSDKTFIEKELKIIEESGVKCITCDLERSIGIGNIIESWKMFLKLKKMLNCKSIVIHGHSSVGGASARLIGILFKILNPAQKCRVIYTPHAIMTMNPDIQKDRIMRWLYSAVESFLALFTDKIIAVSLEEANYIRRIIYNSKKVIIIYNGVPIKEVSPYLKKWKRRILFVGRLSYQKNPMSAILYAKKISNVILSIAGDGELFDECEKIIESEQLSHRVRLLGYVEQIEKLYYEHDILIVSSEYESLPYSVLEAVAADCVVIARPCIGMNELIQNGVAFNWKSIDLETLSLSQYSKMRENSRFALRERYDIRDMIENTKKVYRELYE